MPAGTPSASRRAAAAVGHPQFGLKQLIARLGIAPRRRRRRSAPRRRRSRAAARLAVGGDAPGRDDRAWAGVPQAASTPRPLDAALAGVDLLVARNEQEEALAIALAFREALETPGATVALVTPDRDARPPRRGRARPLGPRGRRFRRRAARPRCRRASSRGSSPRRVAEPADPVALLALLKHPLRRLRHGAARAAGRRRASSSSRCSAADRVPWRHRRARAGARRGAGRGRGRRRAPRPAARGDVSPPTTGTTGRKRSRSASQTHPRTARSRARRRRPSIAAATCGGAPARRARRRGDRRQGGDAPASCDGAGGEALATLLAG